jgi:hypothetical protein
MPNASVTFADVLSTFAVFTKMRIQVPHLLRHLEGDFPPYLPILIYLEFHDKFRKYCL